MRRLTLLLFFLLFASPASADVVKQAPPGAFVSLHDVDPSIIVEMRYLTNHNFMGRRSRAAGRHAGSAPACLPATARA